MSFFAYILKSEKDKRYYYGSCQNLEARVKKHNKGDVKSTKSRRPVVLHYSEKFETRAEAFNREQYFKSINGYNWLKQNTII